MVNIAFMGRTNIVLGDDWVRKARKLTGLKTKRDRR
jgi:Arc/MetJ family transcription regulator